MKYGHHRKLASQGTIRNRGDRMGGRGAKDVCCLVCVVAFTPVGKEANIVPLIDIGPLQFF